MNSIYLSIYLSSTTREILSFIFSIFSVQFLQWLSVSLGLCSWSVLGLRESMRFPLACSVAVFYRVALRAISSVCFLCRISPACCLDNLHHVSEDLCCGPGHSHQGLVGYTFSPNACEAGTERSLSWTCVIRHLVYQL